MKKPLSNNKVSNYIQGLENLKRSDISAAKDSFRRAIDQNPESSFAHHYLGEAHFYSSQLNDAEKSFDRAFELNPHFAPTLLYLGKLADTKGDGAKRDKLFEAALQQTGRSAGELKQLARTLVKIGMADNPAVMDLYLEAHRSNPEDLEIYLEVAEITPPNSGIFAKFGDHLAAAGNSHQAILFFYLAARLQPREGENWMRLAAVLDSSGDVRSADICRSRANEIIEPAD